jgi:hypothetical protein
MESFRHLKPAIATARADATRRRFTFLYSLKLFDGGEVLATKLSSRRRRIIRRQSAFKYFLKLFSREMIFGYWPNRLS